MSIIAKQVADTSFGWYIVHCKIRAERLTADALGRKGFEVFLPMETCEITHARKKQIVSRPLFRGYLFVRLDKERPRFADVRKTHGVHWLVTNVGKPVVVPDKIIEALQERETEGDFDRTKPKKPGLQAGDQVRIKEGPFADLVGEIMALPSERRIDVLLNLYNRKIKFKIPLANVELVR
jgi:transcriptional antiterminator RfaH